MVAAPTIQTQTLPDVMLDQGCWGVLVPLDTSIKPILFNTSSDDNGMHTFSILYGDPKIPGGLQINPDPGGLLALIQRTRIARRAAWSAPRLHRSQVPGSSKRSSTFTSRRVLRRFSGPRRVGRAPNNGCVLSHEGIGHHHCTFRWKGNEGTGPDGRDMKVSVKALVGSSVVVGTTVLPADQRYSLPPGCLLSFGSHNANNRYIFQYPIPNAGVYDRYQLGGVTLTTTSAFSIGQGGFGVVCLARERATDAVFACKIVNAAKFADGPEILDRLRGEAEILANTDHEKFCKLFSVHEIGPIIWLVTEYIAGGTLSDLIESEGGLSEEYTIRLMRDACIAVGYLHSVGITHRDLKPDNIMLVKTHPIRLKLIDMGLAMFGDCLKTICGTPRYMAPEVLQVSNTPYDAKSDCFSLAATAWNAITYNAPSFKGKRGEAQLISTVLRDLAFSDETIDWLQRMLAKNPGDRMTIPEALDHPWLRISTDSPAPEVHSSDAGVADPQLNYYSHSTLHTPAHAVSYTAGLQSNDASQLGNPQASSTLLVPGRYPLPHHTSIRSDATSQHLGASGYEASEGSNNSSSKFSSWYHVAPNPEEGA
ncbi:CAMK family protein kinase [Rhizoctonia solani]|uniref:non-specific serine/threonine protein kinase n=1 Tax=Rhizoctonia solani TaxID=456999 RepID=A0A0K6FR23_9AGAM|nr:CAMK family protein kinase [Rhizoctonia solani]